MMTNTKRYKLVYGDGDGEGFLDIDYFENKEEAIEAFNDIKDSYDYVELYDIEDNKFIACNY